MLKALVVKSSASFPSVSGAYSSSTSNSSHPVPVPTHTTRLKDVGSFLYQTDHEVWVNEFLKIFWLIFFHYYGSVVW